MKMQEAEKIMEHGLAKPGFMVSFERVVGVVLHGDYFPDVRSGEPPIATEEEAWQIAQKFAAKTRGKYVNIYVVTTGFDPVPGYECRKIENR